MTKIIQVLILGAMITVMLSMGTAQACACGEVWSEMSDEEIVTAINGAENDPRIMYGQSGQLPPAPVGYQYTADYMLVLL
jgi:Mn-containing catalase